MSVFGKFGKVLLGMLALALLASAGCGSSPETSAASGTGEDSGFDSPPQGNAPSGNPSSGSETKPLPSGDNWEIMGRPGLHTADGPLYGMLELDVETPAETNDEMEAVAREIRSEFHAGTPQIRATLFYHSGEPRTPSVEVGVVEMLAHPDGNDYYTVRNYIPEQARNCDSAYESGADITETPREWGCWQWYEY